MEANLAEFEHGGKKLARVHAKANDQKYFCYFTGFLDGVAASGLLETGEVEPLIEQCAEFAQNTRDEDAVEFLQDFEANLLEHASIADAVHYRSQEIDVDCKKSTLNRFMGYCAGIACDDLITIDEAIGVVSYAEHHPEILSDNDAAAIVFCCQDAVLDGEIDQQESADICHAITGLVGDSYADTGISSLGSVPLFPEGDFPSNLVELDGMTLVFTGNFEITPRKLLEDQISEFGATIARSVTKKTDFVVVGHEAARDWVFTHKGNKLAKALAMFQEAGRPVLISENQLKRRLVEDRL